jgi:hypothetical protein
MVIETSGNGTVPEHFFNTLDISGKEQAQTRAEHLAISLWLNEESGAK